MATDHEEPASDAVGSRGPEIGLAAVLAVLALLVIVDSLRVGIGWGDDGPKSGYFPFRVGLMLFGASAWILITQWRSRRAADPVFAQRSQLVSVWAVAWPMAVYVALIAGLGIYVASALLIGFFMRHHGHYAWVKTVPVSLAVPLIFFGIFERWFLVPLPKGPLERLLGF